MTMGVFLEEQVAVFLEALAVGAALGAFYDVFRISRVAFYTHEVIVFAEDVIFCVICAIVTFFFGLTVIDGSLRLFLVLGELCGGIVYHNTAGRLVLRVASRIIDAINAVFRFVKYKIFHPIWRILLAAAGMHLRFCENMYAKFKKNLQNAKIRLKSGYKLLYNHIKACLRKKSEKRRAGSKKVIGNEKTGRKKSRKTCA